MKAVVRNRNDLLRFVDEVTRKLGQEFDKPYSVVIKRFVRFRTLDQNKKLHAMIRELAEHTGYSEGEMKDYIKSEFGPKIIISIAGDDKPIPMSSAEWNVEICGYVIEQLERIGSEVGCVYQESE